jgi:hypothetical protein
VCHTARSMPCSRSWFRKSWKMECLRKTVTSPLNSMKALGLKYTVY